MKKNQSKLLTVPVLFLLLTLNACQKSELGSTASAVSVDQGISLINGDSKGLARNDVDPNDVDNRDYSVADNKDADNHKEMKNIIFASTNGSFLEDGKKSQLNFHAEQKTDKKGQNTKGQVEYKFTSGGFKIKGRVNNLVLVSNTPNMSMAKVYGVITKVEGKVPPEYDFVQVGKKFLFQVQDNNDGVKKNQGPDFVSDFVVYTNTTANQDPPPYLQVKGHVEVGQKQ